MNINDIQNEIYEDSVQTLNELFEREKKKWLYLFKDKHICTRSLFVNNYSYIGKCIDLNITLEKPDTPLQSDLKSMIQISLVFESQPSSLNKTTEIALTKILIFEVEMFDTEDDARLFCEVQG